MQSGECPHCGAHTRALQDYCLECGGRLTGAPGVAATLANVWHPRPGWYPAEWAWPVVGLLVVAALALGVVLAYQADDETGFGALIATGPATGPLLSVGAESAPTPTEPALPPQETAPQPQTTTPVANGEPIDWPAAVSDGWTVVLASLPAAGGRASAVDKAKGAIKAGVRDVGILESDGFASLHPGYLVVFAGAYETPSEAQDGVERAQDRGYEVAYVRQITR
jgi:hypothetical protein